MHVPYRAPYLMVTRESSKILWTSKHHSYLWITKCFCVHTISYIWCDHSLVTSWFSQIKHPTADLEMLELDTLNQQQNKYSDHLLNYRLTNELTDLAERRIEKGSIN